MPWADRTRSIGKFGATRVVWRLAKINELLTKRACLFSVFPAALFLMLHFVFGKTERNNHFRGNRILSLFVEYNRRPSLFYLFILFRRFGSTLIILSSKTKKQNKNKKTLNQQKITRYCTIVIDQFVINRRL